jgi:hypothetical protein
MGCDTNNARMDLVRLGVGDDGSAVDLGITELLERLQTQCRERFGAHARRPRVLT